MNGLYIEEAVEAEDLIYTPEPKVLLCLKIFDRRCSVFLYTDISHIAMLRILVGFSVDLERVFYLSADPESVHDLDEILTFSRLFCTGTGSLHRSIDNI
jgi:hypothetical protein